MIAQYSFNQICELRDEVLKHEAYKLGGWYAKDRISAATVEAMVQTYMQAGVKAEEIRAANAVAEVDLVSRFGPAVRA